MKRRSAVLVIDMINDFAYPDGEQLFRNAVPAVRNVAKLITRARGRSVPVIFVNDNFKKWHDSFHTTIEDVKARSPMGAKLIEMLSPTDEDYYILKPHRSGFYKTPLEVLLADLNANRLIITGITTDLCVFFTANDAYMRGFEIVVPRDCVAAVKKADNTRFLGLLEQNMSAKTPLAASVQL